MIVVARVSIFVERFLWSIWLPEAERNHKTLVGFFTVDHVGVRGISQYAVRIVVSRLSRHDSGIPLLHDDAAGNAFVTGS